MHHFSHSQARSNGTYKEFKSGPRHLSATIICPDCGQIMSLASHTIDQNGQVSPSVRCTVCTFHDHIRLDGWAALNHRFLQQEYDV